MPPISNAKEGSEVGQLTGRRTHYKQCFIFWLVFFGVTSLNQICQRITKTELSTVTEAIAPSTTVYMELLPQDKDVTFMLPVINRDYRIIKDRLTQMMKFHRHPFRSRIFAVDSRGQDPSPELKESMENAIKSGLMDSWVLVDYSDAYINSVWRRTGWKNNMSIMDNGRIGNLVYYFMMDHSRTKYVCHFDLDIALWSMPGYSWIDHAISLLKNHKSALLVTPARPHKDGNYSIFDRKSCTPYHYMVSSRWFIIDKTRYNTVLNALHGSETFPKLRYCLGDNHWERVMSCIICHSSLTKISLMNGDKAWALHFPSPKTGKAIDTRRMLFVLQNLVDNGIAFYQNPPKDFNAAPLERWLRGATEIGIR